MENRDAAAAAKDIVTHPIHRGSKELLTAWSSMSALCQKGTLTPHTIKAIRRPDTRDPYQQQCWLGKLVLAVVLIVAREEGWMIF